jgi:hypothetical protein
MRYRGRRESQLLSERVVRCANALAHDPQRTKRSELLVYRARKYSQSTIFNIRVLIRGDALTTLVCRRDPILKIRSRKLPFMESSTNVLI